MDPTFSDEAINFQSEDEEDDADEEDDLIEAALDEDFLKIETNKSSLSGSGYFSCDPDSLSYEIYSPDQLLDYMIECIKDCNTVLQLPITLARVLLHHFQWDKEKLLETYYEGSQEKLFAKAQIPYIVYNERSEKDLYKLGECDICMTSLTLVCYVECSHAFCKQCWSSYVKQSIEDFGSSAVISCPGYKCRAFLSDSIVFSILNDDSKNIRLYQMYILRSFVNFGRRMRWCPGPDCSYAVRALRTDGTVVRVQCSCSHIFCFSCGCSWHEPVRCALLLRWLRKCDDDSETSNWIVANTKECPKCRSTIEKDGGCNHMICQNKNCKTEFCWVCLGPWTPHSSSYYACNRYDEEEARKARTAQEISRENLQRYLCYFNHYTTHMQSLKFEHKLYESIKQKMENMQVFLNMSWIEVQFLKKAVDALCQCRQTLMYTYVFAFYLKRNNQSAIFEENQKDLETSTEILSEFLERNITYENEVAEIRQKVQDKYRYCLHRRQVLLSHVEEGCEKNIWKFNE